MPGREESGRRIKGKTPRSRSSDPTSLPRRGEYDDDDSFRGFATFPSLRQTSQCLPSSTKKGRQSPLSVGEFRNISIRLYTGHRVLSLVLRSTLCRSLFFLPILDYRENPKLRKEDLAKVYRITKQKREREEV